MCSEMHMERDTRKVIAKKYREEKIKYNILL